MLVTQKQFFIFLSKEVTITKNMAGEISNILKQNPVY